MRKEQQFGGNWTEEKLARLEKYLSFYTTALKNQPFSIAYIDAFAGTGYRSLNRPDASTELMFPELVSNETKRFMDGSARIALGFSLGSINTFLSKKIQAD